MVRAVRGTACTPLDLTGQPRPSPGGWAAYSHGAGTTFVAPPNDSLPSEMDSGRAVLSQGARHTCKKRLWQSRSKVACALATRTPSCPTAGTPCRGTQRVERLPNGPLGESRACRYGSPHPVRRSWCTPWCCNREDAAGGGGRGRRDCLVCPAPGHRPDASTRPRCVPRSAIAVAHCQPHFTSPTLFLFYA